MHASGLALPVPLQCVLLSYAASAKALFLLSLNINTRGCNTPPPPPPARLTYSPTPPLVFYLRTSPTMLASLQTNPHMKRAFFSGVFFSPEGDPLSSTFISEGGSHSHFAQFAVLSGDGGDVTGDAAGCAGSAPGKMETNPPSSAAGEMETGDGGAAAAAPPPPTTVLCGPPLETPTVPGFAPLVQGGGGGGGRAGETFAADGYLQGGGGGEGLGGTCARLGLPFDVGGTRGRSVAWGGARRGGAV